MELGLYTFADVGPEIDQAQRLRNLLEEIELGFRPAASKDASCVKTAPRAVQEKMHRFTKKPTEPGLRGEISPHKGRSRKFGGEASGGTPSDVSDRRGPVEATSF